MQFIVGHLFFNTAVLQDYKNDTTFILSHTWKETCIIPLYDVGDHENVLIYLKIRRKSGI